MEVHSPFDTLSLSNSLIHTYSSEGIPRPVTVIVADND